MCGLCGEITFDGSPAAVEALGAMTCSMTPRGPDAEGIVARTDPYLFDKHCHPLRFKLKTKDFAQ